ncbi:unnamed protein product, partial [Mesorhabditis belari]|uniref:C6 domain-containing protein n=1 Tax=Mesorhabditis belari TaxID=2138241 RepID=A0AAF3FKK3_9BILA
MQLLAVFRFNQPCASCAMLTASSLGTGVGTSTFVYDTDANGCGTATWDCTTTGNLLVSLIVDGVLMLPLDTGCGSAMTTANELVCDGNGQWTVGGVAFTTLSCLVSTPCLG